jgi:hypothetical protein
MLSQMSNMERRRRAASSGPQSRKRPPGLRVTDGWRREVAAAARQRWGHGWQRRLLDEITPLMIRDGGRAVTHASLSHLLGDNDEQRPVTSTLVRYINEALGMSPISVQGETEAARKLDALLSRADDGQLAWLIQLAETTLAYHGTMSPEELENASTLLDGLLRSLDAAKSSAASAPPPKKP